MCKGKAFPMKNKQATPGKNQQHKQKLKIPTVPVPTPVTELSEEDLKKVTGGSGADKQRTLVIRQHQLRAEQAKFEQ